LNRAKLTCIVLAAMLILCMVPALAQVIGDDPDDVDDIVTAPVTLLNHVINGTVYCDVNRNGAFNANEYPVAAITIDLLDAAGKKVATNKTDANGQYKFTVIQTGQFTIKETIPGKYVNTTATSAKVTIKTGTSRATKNFAIAAIKGYVPLSGTNGVAVVDVLNDTYTKKITVSNGTSGVVYTPNHRKAYAITDSTVAVINAGTDALKKEIKLYGPLAGIYMVPDGQYVLVTDRSGKIYVIDAVNDTLKSTMSFTTG
jgi:hypothetical protein